MDTERSCVILGTPAISLDRSVTARSTSSALRLGHHLDLGVLNVENASSAGWQALSSKRDGAAVTIGTFLLAQAK
jgi:hypothetical protein